MPEAQLDRFMFSIPVTYPNAKDEIEIVKKTTSEESPQLAAIMDAKELIEYQELVRQVPMEDSLVGLVVELVRRTRPDTEMSSELREVIRYGAGPRASQAIALGAKARALLEGRFSVREEDIFAVAPYVLEHRLVLRRLHNLNPRRVVERLLSAGV